MDNNFQISISDSAITRLKEVLSTKDSNTFLRVLVNSGGCSGFTTSFKLDNTYNEDDLVVEKDGIRVVINKLIAEFVKDAELSFATGALSSYFKFDVKQATEKCSCGSSFNI